jgi:hypothetical protein
MNVLFGQVYTNFGNSDFYKWNPAVKNDCSGLWPDYYYCVGVSGPATTMVGAAARTLRP